MPEVEKSNLPEKIKFDSVRSIPIEDIGMVILDNKQISITHAAIEALTENHSAILTCDERHMPQGLMLPLNGNTLQSERYQDQIRATLPLKKQIWQHANSGINVPLVAEWNVPPVAQSNVPPQKWLR